jgi:hypothetical protein
MTWSINNYDKIDPDVIQRATKEEKNIEVEHSCVDF